MNIKVITPPAAEPVTLTEAKAQCRVDISDDDVLLTGLITAAREKVEELSWHACMAQTLELVLDTWPAGAYLNWPAQGRPTLPHMGFIELPRPPLQSVTSFTYTDSAGTATVWDAANYIAATDCVPGRIVPVWGQHWPSVTLQPVQGLRVRFVAGWSSAALVPQQLKLAILMLVGHWYESREAAGPSKHEIPFGVDVLTQNFRKRAKTS